VGIIPSIVVAALIQARAVLVHLSVENCNFLEKKLRDVV